MYTNSKLAKSIRLALMYGAAATAFSGAAIAQQDQDEEEAAEEERVERIQITGSRIQRTDMEGSVPITTFDRDMIDLSGETSAADFIRNTTFNTAGSFRPQSGSAAQGTSSVNLRGLGSDRTLVLIDGRRLPKSPSTGSNQDLSMIPMGAIERIEILSDGASAVYGSDAIGGVINVITRQDFNGIEMRYGRSEISLPADGGDREEGSVVFGSTSDTTRVVGGVSWNSRDIIFHRDNSSWMDVPRGQSIYGNNFTEGSEATGNLSTWYTLPSEEECNSDSMENFYMVGTFCAYDFTATNANEASTANKGLFVNAEHDINRDWSVYANASYAQATSFGRYAPSLNDPGSNLHADSVNNPSNPDGFTFRQEVYDGTHIGPDNDTFVGNRDLMYWHRFASIGDRDSYVTADGRDFVVGAQGRWGEIDLDFGVRRSQQKTHDIGYNYLLRSNANTLVNITRDEVEAGLAADPDFVFYDMRDPLGTRYSGAQAQNYETLINSMNVTISRVSESEQREWFGSAAFDVMEVGAGMIQGVVGFEYREETYVDQYDSLSEAGQVGGSAGNSAGGGRDVTAAYFETLIPITYDLELTLAGRFDDYSDYGSDFSPKASFRWQPMDELVLRGSWGQGFRAPSLDIITMQDSSGNPSMQDPATCLFLTGDTECSVQVRQITRANPELESESSEQISLGVAYQPTDWLNFAVDYWDISITNRIALFGLNTLLSREATGDTIPPGVGIVRGGTCYTQEEVGAGNPLCAISGVNGGYANDGTFDISGVDFNARTNFDFGEYGRLMQNLQVSHTIESKVDGGNNAVKNPGVPQYRANINNTYVFNDWSFAWNINVIGNQYNTGRDSDGNREGNIGTWVTHDLQFAYNAPWDGTLTVGMRNAFEKEPQLGTNTAARGTRDYNFNLYDAYGRITYFRYTQRF